MIVSSAHNVLNFVAVFKQSRWCRLVVFLVRTRVGADHCCVTKNIAPGDIMGKHVALGNGERNQYQNHSCANTSRNHGTRRLTHARDPLLVCARAWVAFRNSDGRPRLGGFTAEMVNITFLVCLGDDKYKCQLLSIVHSIQNSLWYQVGRPLIRCSSIINRIEVFVR